MIEIFPCFVGILTGLGGGVSSFSVASPSDWSDKSDTPSTPFKVSGSLRSSGAAERFACPSSLGCGVEAHGDCGGVPAGGVGGGVGGGGKGGGVGGPGTGGGVGDGGNGGGVALSSNVLFCLSFFCLSFFCLSFFGLTFLGLSFNPYL